MQTLPSIVSKFLLSRLENAEEHNDEIKACCPFHEEVTPSFYVYCKDEKTQFHCFGCGKHGYIHYLLRYIGGNHLAKNIHEDIPLQNYEWRKERTRIYRADTSRGYPGIYHYYLGRRISVEVCRKFGFRFDLYNTAAIMPVYTSGYYQGTIKRLLDPSSPAKYFIEKNMDMASSIWGYDFIDLSKPCCIVEGILDAAVLWTMGHQAVALLSKWWKQKLPLLRMLERPICIPDNDKESIEQFNRLSTILSGKVFYVPAQYKDVNDWVIGEKLLTVHL